MSQKCWGILLLTWAAFATGADAATTTVSPPGGTPTPGLVGRRTYTLSVTSALGKIIGFNFDRSGNSSFGITGPMGQVSPFGQAAVLNPLPLGPFIEWDPDQDSHFLVKPTDGVALNAAESGHYLGVAFELSDKTAATNTLPFVQIVKSPTATVQLRGQFTIETPSGNVLEDYSFAIPEPASAALTTLAVLGLLSSGRRTAAATFSILAIREIA